MGPSSAEGDALCTPSAGGLNPRGTSGPAPPAPAGTVWRRSSVHAVKSHLAEDLFSFGDRGEAGAKDVLIKYPASGAAGGSRRNSKFPGWTLSLCSHRLANI